MNHRIAYRTTSRHLMQAAMLAGLSVLFSVPAYDQAALVPNAQQQFVGPTGAPYANGSVSMYVPNTFTKKNTWRDTGQTQLNINPVPLDSAGRAVIFGIGNYRQVLKDVNGLQIWDNFTAAPISSAINPATSGAGDFLPLGAVIAISGFTAPTNYVLAYGQAISRVTYVEAFESITFSSSVSCVSASTTLSGISTTAQTRVGAPIEASCLPPGTTVAAILSPTSITASAAAVSTVSTTLRTFPWNNGDGISTFNVPDLRGRVAPGSDCMGGVCASRITSLVFGVSPGPPGVPGGQQANVLTQAQTASYNLSIAGLGWAQDTGTGTGTGTATSNRVGLDPAGHETTISAAGAVVVPTNAAYASQTITVNTLAVNTTTTGHITGTLPSGGSASPVVNVQPSLTINYAIKVLNGTLPLVGVLSLGGMTGDILCGTGFVCTGQTINLSASFGTMAFQNANAVNITGGTITGMPICTNASDVCPKSYIDGLASGINNIGPSRLATTAVLPNTPTYSNGASGVGATLTSTGNTTLTVDGTIANLNDVVLVKNQASAFQNGPYLVTAAGSGAAQWVLTRVTVFDQAAEMKAGSYTTVTAGATLVNNSYTLAATVTTVGTDPLNWNLFTQSPILANASIRTKAAGALTFYNRVDGNDTACTGLTNAAYVSGAFPQNCAFLTQQGAYNYIYATYDFVGTGSATVNIQPGTYNCAVDCLLVLGGVPLGTSPSASSAISFVGDNSTPSNVVLNAVSAPLLASWGGQINIGGVKMVSSSSNSIYASAHGRINLTNFVDFGSCAVVHIQANVNGVVVFNTGYFISGSCNPGGHLYASANGTIETNSGSVTSPGVPGFTTFATAINGGVILAGATYPMSAVGTRYLVDWGAIETNPIGGPPPVFFPGTAPGSISPNGGKYQ